MRTSEGRKDLQREKPHTKPAQQRQTETRTNSRFKKEQRERKNTAMSVGQSFGNCVVSAPKKFNASFAVSAFPSKKIVRWEKKH